MFLIWYAREPLTRVPVYLTGEGKYGTLLIQVQTVSVCRATLARRAVGRPGTSIEVVIPVISSAYMREPLQQHYGHVVESVHLSTLLLALHKNSTAPTVP